MDIGIYFAVTILIPLVLQIFLIWNKSTRFKMFVTCLVMNLVLSILEVTGVAALIATSYDYLGAYLLTLFIIYFVIQTVVLIIICRKYAIPKYGFKMLPVYLFPIGLASLQIVGTILS